MQLSQSQGQYYYNARWYDPSIGRITTEDPMRDGLNWYAYANNNPLKFVDPSGLANLTSYTPDNPYYYYSSSKVTDTVIKSLSLIPYIGVGAGIAESISNKFGLFEIIDLNKQSQIDKASGGLSSAGTVAGIMNKLGEGFFSNGFSKVLGVLSTIGTIVGLADYANSFLSEPSLETEKAVDASGVVQGKHLDTLIPFAKEVEELMSGYLDSGDVEIIERDDGTDTLQWNSQASKDAFNSVVEDYQRNEVERTDE